MSGRGGVAFADAEDEWTSDDETGYQEMVLAEGAGELVKLSKLVHRPDISMALSRRLPLFSLSAHGHKITFTRALMVELEDDDGGGALLGSPELRMWGSGANPFEALHDFSETFVSVLTSYEATPSEKLTRDADEYLRSLQSLVASRETT